MARKNKETVSNEAAQKMIDSGEAKIPSEAIIGNKKVAELPTGMSGHKKFDKFKKETSQNDK